MNTDTMGTLAQEAADRLVTLWERWEAGEVDRKQFIALAVVLLSVSRARAAALADLGLAADLTRLRGTPVAPVGLAAPVGTPLAAVEDTLAGPPYALAPAVAVAVLGRSETLAAVQDTYSEGLRVSNVYGWTRVLNSGACELCVGLAGEVLPASAQMFHHKGCGCSQRPVEETA